MATVACLAMASGFGDTRNRTSPLPWLAVGERSVIQLASAEAVQLHSGCVVIVAALTVPVAATGLSDGASESAHFAGEGPVAVEVDVCPQAAVIKAPASIPRETQCAGRGCRSGAQTDAKNVMMRCLFGTGPEIPR